MKLAIIGSGNVGPPSPARSPVQGTTPSSLPPRRTASGRPPSRPRWRPRRRTRRLSPTPTSSSSLCRSAPSRTSRPSCATTSPARSSSYVTNPLAPGLSGLATTGTSAAELVQQAAPGARVVKAFNTVTAANQAEAAVDGTQLDGFVAGDDDEAKHTVLDLLAAIGYRPCDVGPLSFARYLEGMALVNLALNARNGWSWRSAWKLVGPPS